MDKRILDAQLQEVHKIEGELSKRAPHPGLSKKLLALKVQLEEELNGDSNKLVID
jgi:hypothetical protein